MKRISNEEALAILSGVVDPATGRDVVSSGLVKGLVVKDGNVGFALEVDPREGAAKEPLRAACEQALSQAPGVISVTAVLTAHHDAPGKAPARANTNPEHTHAHAHAHTRV